MFSFSFVEFFFLLFWFNILCFSLSFSSGKYCTYIVVFSLSHTHTHTSSCFSHAYKLCFCQMIWAKENIWNLIYNKIFFVNCRWIIICLITRAREKNLNEKQPPPGESRKKTKYFRDKSLMRITYKRLSFIFDLTLTRQVRLQPARLPPFFLARLIYSCKYGQLIILTEINGQTKYHVNSN